MKIEIQGDNNQVVLGNQINLTLNLNDEAAAVFVELIKWILQYHNKE